MLPLERTVTADTPPFLWLLCGNQVVAVVWCPRAATQMMPIELAAPLVAVLPCTCQVCEGGRGVHEPTAATE